MASKASRWCGKCKKVHAGNEQCPHRVAFGGKTHGKKRTLVGRARENKRRQIFERDGYLCQEHCRQGQIVPVELHGPKGGILDHIIPVGEGGNDEDLNLETLCQACHNIKTHAESQRGRGVLKV